MIIPVLLIIYVLVAMVGLIIGEERNLLWSRLPAYLLLYLGFFPITIPATIVILAVYLINKIYPEQTK